jgi:glycosyltransferase involved in cell wall biosynthesis
VNLLLVTYFYPPGRDTGAVRPATMAKYLRRLGHRVTVLTTSAYGEGSDDEADVIRTRDLQRTRARMHGKERIDALYDAGTYSGKPHPLSKVFVPEPLVAAWAPFARSAALRRHREDPFDAVITTSPPESVHLIGEALAKRGVPWVAELRDAWGFESLRPRFPTGAQRRLDERLERRWLRDADAVVVVSEPAAEDLRKRLGIDARVITNGWDPELAPNPPADTRREGDEHRYATKSALSAGVRLVYTGRFGGPGREPAPLVDAMAQLAKEDPEAAQKLELVVAGPLTDAEAGTFARGVAPARITLLGSLERTEALALQRGADALLLIAHPVRSQLLNLKLFEYLASGRPILALAEGTEAGRVAAEAGCEVVAGGEVDAISASLRRLTAGELEPPDPSVVTGYTYPRPAERLAEVIERAVAQYP